MTRRVRIILGIIILSVSITLLIWGFKPLGNEVRTQPLDPSELQLPTPVSFLTYPFDTAQDKPEIVS
jgi:hypothetical protein